MPWDPDSGETFGEYVRAKGVQTRPSGWTAATRDQTREGRDKQGRRFKAVTDQLGNDTIQHGADQQSVHIKSPPTVTAKIPVKGRADVER